MQLCPEDRQFIHTEIRKKYEQVALNPKGQFAYPTGREGLEKLHYDQAILADLPDAVADSFCGVGNLFSLGDITPGYRVLDIGCGAGVDALVAAQFMGDTGEVLGIDLTPEMIEKANANKALMKADNVTFEVCDVRDLEKTEDGFDVILSNGVFNLVPEKEAALASAFRLLKPGGRIFMADQFATGSPPQDIRERVKTWFQ